MTTPDPITMTNDEAQDWLLSLLNATPPPRDAARFGAAIRAIRAKAIADAKEWGLASQPEPLDVERLARAMMAARRYARTNAARAQALKAARAIAAEYARLSETPR